MCNDKPEYRIQGTWHRSDVATQPVEVEVVVGGKTDP